MLKLLVLAATILASAVVSVKTLRYDEYNLDVIIDNPKLFKNLYYQCAKDRRHCAASHNKFKVSERISQEKEGENSGWAWLLQSGTESCESMLEIMCGDRSDGPCGTLGKRIEFCREEKPQPVNQVKTQLLNGGDEEEEE